MGRLNRAEEEASLNEALLYVTLCIIGRPVDVHVKDGSVFSGIFYTTSVDREYGIVLKKARMTRKGKSGGAFVEGAEVETLVISSGDLVQIVVKGFVFPSNVVAGDVAGDSAEAAVISVPSPNIPLSETKNFAKSTTDKKTLNQIRTPIQNGNGSAYTFSPTKAGKENERRKLQPTHIGHDMEAEHGKRDGINIDKGPEVHDALVPRREVGDDWSGRKQDDYKISETHTEKSVDKVQGLRSSKEINGEAKVVTCHPVGGEHAKIPSKLLPNGVSHDTTSVPNEPENKIYERPASSGTSPDTACSILSTSSSTNTVMESCFSSLTASTDVNPPQKSESNRSSKEFKLNPEAKIFSPSFANPVSAAPPVTTSAASMAYLPPIVPVAAARPEVGITAFAPRTSVPSKISTYNNLSAANSGSVSQFSQPVAGHGGGRTQPPRYTSQYHPVQAGQEYVPPNSQAVMIGRFEQLVYVQPVPQDLVHGAAAISTMSARPLLAPHQVQMPKHQGIGGQALHLYGPPPFVANGQPFAVPSHIPLLQHPVPASTSMPLLGSNALFSTKFT